MRFQCRLKLGDVEIARTDIAQGRKRRRRTRRLACHEAWTDEAERIDRIWCAYATPGTKQVVDPFRQQLSIRHVQWLIIRQICAADAYNVIWTNARPERRSVNDLLRRDEPRSARTDL